MSSKSTHHCSFSAVVEFMDAPRIQRGSTVLIPATLQGPAWTSIPDLQIISDIPLEIDFYNESDEILTKGSVAVCFGCVCFKDQSPAILKLSVRASRLSPCPGNPLLDSYVDSLPPMMNAFVDFVGIVNRQLPKQDNYRFFSVSMTAYAGRTAGTLTYETFNFCCVLPPGDRWKKVEPRTGRTVQVQGDLVGFYLVEGRISPCVLTQTLSYIGQSAVAPDSASGAPPPPSTPRKRRLGEVVRPTLTAAPLPASTPAPTPSPTPALTPTPTAPAASQPENVLSVPETDLEPSPPPPAPRAGRPRGGKASGKAS
ncbi:hypothetical protein V8E54_012267 [Elaphomyces granulatus]|jgi:hypothetical protein